MKFLLPVLLASSVASASAFRPSTYDEYFPLKINCSNVKDIISCTADGDMSDFYVIKSNIPAGITNQQLVRHEHRGIFHIGWGHITVMYGNSNYNITMTTHHNDQLMDPSQTDYRNWKCDGVPDGITVCTCTNGLPDGCLFPTAGE